MKLQAHRAGLPGKESKIVSAVANNMFILYCAPDNAFRAGLADAIMVTFLFV